MKNLNDEMLSLYSDSKFITFEVAKLAKKRGFVSKHYHYNYGDDKKLYFNVSANILKDEPKYACVSQSILRKWIREEHHINIEILFTTEGTYIYKIIEKEYTKISCNGITYKTYEEALEDALYEILNELI